MEPVCGEETPSCGSTPCAEIDWGVNLSSSMLLQAIAGRKTVAQGRGFRRTGLGAIRSLSKVFRSHAKATRSGVLQMRVGKALANGSRPARSSSRRSGAQRGILEITSARGHFPDAPLQSTVVWALRPRSLTVLPRRSFAPSCWECGRGCNYLLRNPPQTMQGVI